MVARRVYAEGTVRRKNVTCGSCASVFQATYIEGMPFTAIVTCDACVAIREDDTVKARISSQGDCATCGRHIVLEDGVPTHLERERDDFHRPMYVTRGF